MRTRNEGVECVCVVCNFQAVCIFLSAFAKFSFIQIFPIDLTKPQNIKQTKKLRTSFNRKKKNDNFLYSCTRTNPITQLLLLLQSLHF
jgi:hypothetical protein